MSQNVSNVEEAISGMEPEEYNLYEDLDLDTLSVGVGMFGADPNFKARADGDDETDESGAKTAVDEEGADSKVAAKKVVGSIPIGSSSVANITAMIPGLAVGNSKTKAAPAAAKVTPTTKTAAPAKPVAPMAAPKVPIVPAVAAKAPEKKTLSGTAAKPDGKYNMR